MGFPQIWESISPARRRLMNEFGAAEHVGDDVGAMQPGEHVLAVADPAMNERHVMDLIERSHKSVTGQCADLGFDWKLADAFDQFVAGLPVGNKFGDGDTSQLLPLGEFGKLGARITVPSSFISSARTPTEGTPASRHKSTQA